MNTYLIFFGKSQDFEFHVFNKDGYVPNFDEVIRDFDLLESKYFTVDQVDNKEILAKYNFISPNRKAYSLLKLYSFAQVYDGNRIEGNIYGVAFLSESDVELSERNYKLLEELKSQFAKRSIKDLKFVKSTFYSEAEMIYQAFLAQNFFSIINLDGIPNVSNSTFPRAYYLNDLATEISLVQDQIVHSSRLYFTTDLGHLIRAKAKLKRAFSIFLLENGVVQEYREAENGYGGKHLDEPRKPASGPEVDILKRENDALKIEIKKLGKSVRKKSMLISFLLVAAALTTAIFFLKPNFKGDGHFQQTGEKSSSETGYNKSKFSTAQGENESLELNHILLDSDRVNLLSKLCSNVRLFKNKMDLSYYLAILRDARLLGIDESFYKGDVNLLTVPSLLGNIPGDYIELISKGDSNYKFRDFLRKKYPKDLDHNSDPFLDEVYPKPSGYYNSYIKNVWRLKKPKTEKTYGELWLESLRN